MLQKIFIRFPKTELERINPKIMEDNRRFTLIWSLIESLFWVFCFFITFFNDMYFCCKEIYVIALIVSLYVLFCTIFLSFNHYKLIKVNAIFVDLILLFAGVFIAQRLAPQTIVIFASVLIVPVMFISDSISTIFLLFIDIIVFIIIGRNSMDLDIFKWVLSNLIIFSM